MLDGVSSDLDKREGSVIYTALAPAAAELAIMYIEIDQVLKQIFADTADREFLIRRAAERGIIPKAASYAELKARFNMEIPIGSRFSLNLINYKTIEKLGDFEYRMRCETIGTSGNAKLGRLIPIEYIKGLTSAELTVLLIPGEEEEETERFRRRYFDSLNSQAYGGNIADYKEKVLAISGVGGIKVFPAWNGGGTVKLVIIDSSFRAPSSELIESVQEQIDPISDQGKGYGIAPIGHKVSVLGAEAEVISITAKITYQAGYDAGRCKDFIEKTMDEYIEELNHSWQELDNIIVRISRIESRLLDVEGVLDVMDTNINGAIGNYVIPSEKIALRGDANV
jgi:uncharacterized phage protein gp47/JayE